MNTNSPSVKILICYHKPDILLKDDVFTPIHVGRANAKKRMAEDNPNLKWLLENMIGDDTGDNISEKNSSYNEITALYWAWKNYDALGNPDYIGLMHYRRHFIFRKSYDVVETITDIGDDYFQRLNYNENSIAHLFDDCDYVAHIGRVDNIYKHYKENHHVEDLDLAISILKKKYPEYASTANKYLNMSYCNLCNMFILPKAEFFEYCEWLFSILFEFESRVDLTDKRLFISERMTGIFMEHLKKRGLRQKSLSVTFLRSPIRIPVAVPYAKGDTFKTAALMQSVLMNKKSDVSVDFYLLEDGAENGAEELTGALEKFEDCTVTSINVRGELERLGINAEDFDLPKQYPLVLPELLPSKNKVLYLNQQTLFLNDISDFFITCNNDEFDALTLPKAKNGENRDIFCLNTARMRKYNFTNTVAKSCRGKEVREVIEANSKSGVNTFAWWLYNISTSENDAPLYYKTDIRLNVKNRAYEKCIIYFDKEMEPCINAQGAYARIWWETASHVPSSVKFDLSSEGAYELMHAQNVALNEYCETIKYNGYVHKERIFKIRWKKFKKYYKKHGFFRTVAHIFNKAVNKYLVRK